MLRYFQTMLTGKKSLKGFLVLIGLSLMLSMPASAQRRGGGGGVRGGSGGGPGSGGARLGGGWFEVGGLLTPPRGSSACPARRWTTSLSPGGAVAAPGNFADRDG